MKTFFHLMNEGEFHNQHLAMTWKMVESHIKSAASYIEAGHDPKQVLHKVAEQVKVQLQELEMYL